MYIYVALGKAPDGDYRSWRDWSKSKLCKWSIVRPKPGLVRTTLDQCRILLVQRFFKAFKALSSFRELKIVGIYHLP